MNQDVILTVAKDLVVAMIQQGQIAPTADSKTKPEDWAVNACAAQLERMVAKVTAIRAGIKT
jgi:hypothetical protein